MKSKRSVSRFNKGTLIATFTAVIDSGTLLQDRYLIEDKIGMGGMGAVYRALDQKFGSQVAIKTTFYGDAELAAAFEREARLLNGLHHPILPHVSDYFAENGEYFLVMEYIEGEDLSELIKRGEKFSVKTVLGWALDLLDGLDYLHSQDPPVIHRDIKPHNMKLTSRGKVMLLDFGMAKISSNTLAAKSVFGYSRRYSPFEQIEGTGTDERSDIFSLGASVYQLLTGEPPVDVLRRMSAIVGGSPDPLVPASVVNADIPTAVSEILNAALALNAENRFESARAMWNALEYSINAENTSPHAVAPAVPEDGVNNIETQAAEAVPVSEPALVDDDNTTPMPVSIPAATTVVAHVGSQSLKRAVREAIPASISKVRIRRAGNRAGSRKWLPLLAACLVIALVAAFIAYRGENAPVAENEPSTSATTPETQDVVSGNVVEPGTEDANADTIQPGDSETTAQDTLKVDPDLRSGPVVRTREGASASQPKATRPAQADPVEPRSENQKASTQRPRRVSKPAFEQPAVSSIEAIMTGVPYESRARWDDRRGQWVTDEEFRRRQMRRIMRENRRRQLPY